MYGEGRAIGIIQVFNWMQCYYQSMEVQANEKAVYKQCVP